MSTPVVKTVNLTKRYGTLVALSNLNLVKVLLYCTECTNKGG